MYTLYKTPEIITATEESPRLLYETAYKALSAPQMSLADALAFPPSSVPEPVIDPSLLEDVKMQPPGEVKIEPEPKEEDEDMGDLFGDDT